MDTQWLKPKNINFYKSTKHIYIFNGSNKTIPMQVTQKYICDNYINDEDPELIRIFNLSPMNKN